VPRWHHASLESNVNPSIRARRSWYSRRMLCHCAVIALIVCAVEPARSADPSEKVQPAAREKKPLVVCAVPDSMPRTGKAEDGSGQGLDIAVARLVATELGRPLEIHWCASAACSWKCVGEKRCDLVIGQPHGSGPPREIAWSIPYSGSRFGLVVHQDTTGIRS